MDSEVGPRRSRRLSLVRPAAEGLSREDMEALLRRLMPGQWNPSHLTRLHKLLPGPSSCLGPLSTPPMRVPTLREEYQPLAQALAWESVATVLDPWCGLGTTRAALAGLPATKHLRTTLSDVDPRVRADAHGDALDEDFLRGLGPFDALVTSPLFALLDLAVPLMAAAARRVACVHVPGHFFSNMPGPRRDWFALNRDRIALLTNLPCGPMGRRCAWLCVFESAATKAALWRPSAQMGQVDVWLAAGI